MSKESCWDRETEDGKTVADEIVLPSAKARAVQYEGHLDWLPGLLSDVLDVGCGDGNMAEVFTLMLGIEYRGCDSSEGMLKRARQLHPTQPFGFGDIYALPYNTDALDLAFCQDVLHHLSVAEGEAFPVAAVEELKRVGRTVAVQHRCHLGDSREHKSSQYEGIERRFEPLDLVDEQMRGLGAVRRWVRGVYVRFGLEVADVFWVWE